MPKNWESLLQIDFYDFYNHLADDFRDATWDIQAYDIFGPLFPFPAQLPNVISAPGEKANSQLSHSVCRPTGSWLLHRPPQRATPTPESGLSTGFVLHAV